MNFDFDTVQPRRSSDSLKWCKYAADILPLWIADMDFQAAPAIRNALQRRVEHGIFGYASASREAVDAVLAHAYTHYRWCIDPEWLVWLPGVVSGLYVATRAFAAPGEAVLCNTPVYPPFLTTPGHAGRQLQTVPFAYDRRARIWQIDFDALRAAMTRQTRLFFLCNPHNPIGRVLRRAELHQLAEFCLRHDLILVSDEIHCDLILDDLPHVSAGTLDADVAARTVVLLSPSKAYNIAGLNVALAVISDAALRARFIAAGQDLLTDVGPLGYTACAAAYGEGDAWRAALLDYLRGNRQLLLTTLARDCPSITAEAPIEATCLAWLNIEAQGWADPAAQLQRHGLALSDGAAFGAAPGRYVRLNFGCPRSLLGDALQRLQRAVADGG